MLIVAGCFGGYFKQASWWIKNRQTNGWVAFDGVRKIGGEKFYHKRLDLKTDNWVKKSAQIDFQKLTQKLSIKPINRGLKHWIDGIHSEEMLIEHQLWHFFGGNLWGMRNHSSEWLISTDSTVIYFMLFFENQFW